MVLCFFSPHWRSTPQPADARLDLPRLALPKLSRSSRPACGGSGPAHNTARPARRGHRRRGHAGTGSSPAPTAGVPGRRAQKYMPPSGSAKTRSGEMPAQRPGHPGPPPSRRTRRRSCRTWWSYWPDSMAWASKCWRRFEVQSPGSFARGSRRFRIGSAGNRTQRARR